jgi:anaerobic selenocysteine-containing dehydrogenase
MDPRLSNTASQRDHWLPTYPGQRGGGAAGHGRVLLDEGLADLATSSAGRTGASTWRPPPGATAHVRRFLHALREHYRRFTPEFAEAESGVPGRRIVEVARLIGRPAAPSPPTCGAGRPAAT